MRIETVINTPRDVGCKARLPNLDELAGKARAINTRILDAERVGQGCVLASPAFERIAHPTVNAEGRRTPALRFGDPRVMALTGALCQTLLAATGFTNKSLRALITGLLGSGFPPKSWRIPYAASGRMAVIFSYSIGGSNPAELCRRRAL